MFRFLGVKGSVLSVPGPYLLRVCSVLSPYKGTFMWSRYGGDTEQALFYTLFKRNQSREADSVNGIKVSPESPMDREIRKKEESYSKCSAPKNSGQWKFGFSSSIGFQERKWGV